MSLLNALTLKTFLPVTLILSTVINYSYAAKQFVTIGPDASYGTHTKLNRLGQLNESKRSWIKTDQSSTFNFGLDLYSELLYSPSKKKVTNRSFYGAFLRFIPFRGVDSTGTTGASEEELTKTTSLIGVTLGPIYRFYFFDPGPWGVFAEANFGAGLLYVTQSITTPSATSKLYANAYAFETGLNIGGNYLITGRYGIQAKAGYSFYRTNFLTVSSNDGTLYSGQDAGERMVLLDSKGNDLTSNLDRSAFHIVISFVYYMSSLPF